MPLRRGRIKGHGRGAHYGAKGLKEVGDEPRHARRRKIGGLRFAEVARQVWRECDGRQRVGGVGPLRGPAALAAAGDGWDDSQLPLYTCLAMSRPRDEDGTPETPLFMDPAMGELRLACGCWDGKVRIFDPVTGGEALVVIDVGSEVRALAVFPNPATGASRLACSCFDGKVRTYDPVAGAEALLVLDGCSLVVFTDATTGAPRLVTSYGKVFDPVAGGDALLTLDGGGSSLVVFTDPATGETRLASGNGETVRAWDLSKGGAALRVVAFDAGVSALAVTSDMSRLFVASGKGWGEFRTGSS